MSSSPAVFPIFEKLPLENRCQIWWDSVRSWIVPSAVLQVIQESRREGLTIYHELRLGPVPIQNCYVNFEWELVYLRTDLESHNIASPMLDAR